MSPFPRRWSWETGCGEGTWSNSQNRFTCSLKSRATLVRNYFFYGSGRSSIYLTHAYPTKNCIQYEHIWERTTKLILNDGCCVWNKVGAWEVTWPMLLFSIVRDSGVRPNFLQYLWVMKWHWLALSSKTQKWLNVTLAIFHFNHCSRQKHSSVNIEHHIKTSEVTVDCEDLGEIAVLEDGADSSEYEA